jgi:nitrous oxidase accessory protein
VARRLISAVTLATTLTVAFTVTSATSRAAQPVRPSVATSPETLVVQPSAGTPVADAVRQVRRHGVIQLRAGVYAEPTIIVRQPLTLAGDSGAILDGGGVRELLVIGADSVTVRGLTFQNTGSSQATDRAALRVVESAGCLIENNRFENTLFGIYLQRASACLVRRNHLRGIEGSQTVTGNGLHLWSSRDIVLEDNVITGHRDGIYFEFVTNGVVRRNISERSHRYGLHFMFSDSCRYEDNTFRDNESGVAVMYSKRVRIAGNTFERNRGSAAYGLLLKEITDSEVLRNQFIDNSAALHLEGSSRNAVIDNDFVRNGWAVRVLADAQDNVLRGNAFQDNVFDVGTNSRRNYSTFDGNWWDRYRGYDLDHNGRGDVAHAPVRLFALLVEQSPPALILTRSILVDLLDVAERVMPMLSPETLRDHSPLMHQPRRTPSRRTPSRRTP